jgi:hypothetical protein
MVRAFLARLEAALDELVRGIAATVATPRTDP